MNPSDDPALSSGPQNNDNDEDDTNNDPSSNEFQNLFHDASSSENNNNNSSASGTNMQLEPGGYEVSTNGQWTSSDGMGINERRLQQLLFPNEQQQQQGRELGIMDAAVPPLPPPLDSTNNGEHGGQQQQREEAIVVVGEIIGPQPQQQQQEEEVEQETTGVPVETIQLWEEVAYGLEKNQTGELSTLLFCLQVAGLLFIILLGGRGDDLYLPLLSQGFMSCPLLPFTIQQYL